MYKIYNSALQLSVLVFTLALVYFAFVYYPSAVRQYKQSSIPGQKPLVAPVSAVTAKFPIETKNYRITYDEKSNTYYAFITGSKLDAYLLNRNSAQLTLKNALSAETLCTHNVIYASSENLEIPDQYKKDNCK